MAKTPFELLSEYLLRRRSVKLCPSAILTRPDMLSPLYGSEATAVGQAARMALYVGIVDPVRSVHQHTHVAFYVDLYAVHQEAAVYVSKEAREPVNDPKQASYELGARVFIEAQPSNQLANKALRIFLLRDEELLLRPDEVWKMDLHTFKWLRDRGRTLEATLAAEAAQVYLAILQAHLFEFLPGEGITIVTGRGLRTGGRTFLEVGQRLFPLLGTVVSRYTAHVDCGAYSVWLLCPSKAHRV